MNTCDACAYWTRPEPGVGDFDGKCSCPKFITGDNDCLEDGLVYWDSMVGWDSGFNTGPKFGCIHFKSK